ncbi:UDP-N-acetylglucosamine 2-epimerase (non-hydrolyzing), partial [Haloferax sp. Atlit-10N]|uniref:UDP-N-acetylglucosamine 2-epimerase n=1 Tax=Haloferax sp. Atlit-10N TaxID=2077204 RepID=UPI000E368C60
TGNTIVDAVETFDDDAATSSQILSELGVSEGQFDLLSAHRAETVDDREAFERILSGVARASAQAKREVIYPIQPRAKDRLEEFGIAVPDQIRLIEPLDFFDFLRLESTADLVFTDSGGVQEESSILGTPCVTLRYGTERPETAFAGANCVAGREPSSI